MRLRGFDVAKQSLQSDLVVRLRLRREATQRTQRKRDTRPRANHQIHQRTDGSRITSFCFLVRRFLVWTMIEDLLGMHRRRPRLTSLHAKVGEHLLDILVLVNGHGPIGMIVELDPEERTRGAQINQSELCLQC
jgi:hypothetical protein